MIHNFGSAVQTPIHFIFYLSFFAHVNRSRSFHGKLCCLTLSLLLLLPGGPTLAAFHLTRSSETGNDVVKYFPFKQKFRVSMHPIGHFGKYYNALCLFLQILPKHFFSWDLPWSQKKTKRMLMQNFGGQTKSIMVFSKMAYIE